VGLQNDLGGILVKALMAVATAMTLVGCASVVNDTTHAVRVDTKRKSGAVVTGADCVATNDYGSTNFKSGGTQALRRSAGDMTIACTKNGEQPANARLISRPNGGMAGNILLGGVIGAVVDHNRGTAYTYPTWVELVFGESLVFDRSLQTGDAVMKGVAAGSATAKASSSATASANAPAPALGRSNASSHQCMQQLPGAIC
jgi:hypothetical protein